MKYQKVGFDSDKNAYIISERDDSGRLIGTYTAYPDFKFGTFSLYPRTIQPGQGYSGKKKIDMSAVEAQKE